MNWDRIKTGVLSALIAIVCFAINYSREENKCEGMIPMRDLGDDYYEFDERNYCLVGRRTRQRISLGDKMKIRVASANLEKKQLNFAPVDDNARSHGPRGRNRQLRGEEPDFSEEGWQ